MEPVHGGRDDNWRIRYDRTFSPPQWSPSTEDGTTRDYDVVGAVIAEPQWSPSTEDGTTSTGLKQTSKAEWKPQWSPSTEDGTTR